MSSFSTSKIKEILEADRAHLVHQLDELGASESGDLRPDIDFGGSFADAASVTAERTEVIGLVDSIKAQLNDVDAALGRLADGSYGTCARCGAEIAQERLDARPASILCVDCKSAVSV
ncbi:MAG TPA: TraR/DksA family transcriptional regulator [Acidimicrobiia bacterium]